MITSLHNPRIQAVRRLQSQAKARRQQGEFAIEGVRLAEEALRRGWPARLVLYSHQLDKRGQDVVAGFARLGVPIDEVTEAVMSAISEMETPQGLLAVLQLAPLPLPPKPDFLLILDGVRDPGNLGTILRSAAAAGAQAILLAPGCADAWSPKVVRAAMGAHFTLPIHILRWVEIEKIIHRPAASLRVYLADASAQVLYTTANLTSPLAIIVGGEATGAGSQAAAMADERISIPMPGGSESLNAAVAASLLVFEVVRQRAIDKQK